MITTEMSRKRGRCLALAAVLAMAICAFAVAMPASDAAVVEKTDITGVSETPITEDAEIGGSATNYKVTKSVTLTIDGSNDVTLYVKNGVTVSLAANATSTGTITILAADDDAAHYLANDTTFKFASFTAGKVIIKAIYGDAVAGTSSSYEMSNIEAYKVTATITATPTTENTTNGTFSVPGGMYFYGPAVAKLACAVDVADSSEHIYYGTTEVAVVNNNTAKTITVYKGTTTIKNAEGNASDVVTLTDIESAVGIKFGYASDEMTITGGASSDKGTIRVTAGSIKAADNNFGFPGLAAFKPGAEGIPSGALLGATPAAVGVVDGNGVLTGNVDVYGNMSVPEIKIGGNQQIWLQSGSSLDAAIYAKASSGDTYTKFISGTVISPPNCWSPISWTTEGPALTIGGSVQMDAEVFQEVTVNNLAVIAGQTLTFDTNGKIKVNDTSKMVILGTVTGVQGEKIALGSNAVLKTVKTNVASLQQYAASGVTVEALDADDAPTNTGKGLYDYIVQGYKEIKLTGNVTLGSNISATALNAEGVTIVFAGAYKIAVGSADCAFSLNLVNSTLEPGTAAALGISVVEGSTLSIDGSEIHMPIAVAPGATIEVEGVTIENLDQELVFQNNGDILTAEIGAGKTVIINGHSYIGGSDGTKLIIDPSTGSVAIEIVDETVLDADESVVGGSGKIITNTSGATGGAITVRPGDGKDTVTISGTGGKVKIVGSGGTVEYAAMEANTVIEITEDSNTLVGGAVELDDGVKIYLGELSVTNDCGEGDTVILTATGEGTGIATVPKGGAVSIGGIIIGGEDQETAVEISPAELAVKIAAGKTVTVNGESYKGGRNGSEATIDPSTGSVSIRDNPSHADDDNTDEDYYPYPDYRPADNSDDSDRKALIVVAAACAVVVLEILLLVSYRRK